MPGYVVVAPITEFSGTTCKQHPPETCDVVLVKMHLGLLLTQMSEYSFRSHGDGNDISMQTGNCLIFINILREWNVSMFNDRELGMNTIQQLK